MRIEVEAFATLSGFVSACDAQGRTRVELPEGSTVADVTRALGIPGGMALLALVNGRDARPHDRLSGDDVVTLFPPLVGG